MTEKTEYNLYLVTDPWLPRTVSTLVFYAFLAFIVWLSIGSVWWTFLFGTIALLAIFGKAKLYLDKYQRVFHSKGDLQAFVNALPEDSPPHTGKGN